MFLLDLLYKTVLWCFLFDFMLISNGTGHSFIVFYLKKEIKVFEYFLKHVKNLFWNKILALLRSILGDFLWLKFCPNHWAIFSRKKFAQRGKKSPKWQNFAQSGHPDHKVRSNKLCLFKVVEEVVDKTPSCQKASR